MPSHLAQQFKHYRMNVKDLSMRAVATAADCNVATVFKVEHDKPVSYETFERILIEGLGYGVRTKVYKELQALWIEMRGSGNTFNLELSEELANVAVNKRMEELMKKVAPLLQNIPFEMEEDFLKALANKKIIKLIPGLVRLGG